MQCRGTAVKARSAAKLRLGSRNRFQNPRNGGDRLAKHHNICRPASSVPPPFQGFPYWRTIPRSFAKRFTPGFNPSRPSAL
jgi:hypothetical protein